MEELTRANGSGIEVVTLERDGQQVTTLRGLAAVYYQGSPGSEFQLWDNCYERLAPGCFDAVLKSSPDVFCRINHDRSKPLGRTPKTLRLWSDNRGLNFECELGATSTAKDAVELVRREEYRGCSFRFAVDLENPTEVQWTRDGAKDVCLIKAVKALKDVSIVDEPAYKDTAVTLYRSAYDAWRADEETRQRVEKLRALTR